MEQIILEAERLVAVDSPDHIVPWGTKQDNSVNPNFNRKLYRLFAGERPTLRVLDLGCSGGGFVRNCVDDGCFAVGIEGSDYSKTTRRAEWRTIPERLFTGDISRAFQLYKTENGTRRALQFDVITLWEVIEHIAEADLPALAENVSKHLATGGLWIMSVSPNEEIIRGVRLHQTVQPKPWWIHRLRDLGFAAQSEHLRYFNTQFVRGPKFGGPGSFNLVLAKIGDESVPSPPSVSFAEMLFDRWVGSRPHRLIKTLTLGQMNL